MRASCVVATTLVLTVVSGCDRPAPSAASSHDPLFSAAAAGANANVPDAWNFVAHLSGDDEVPARDTRGVGELKLQLSADGQALEYRLIASNINNVVASHIHIAPAGVNGSIVVFLFGNAPAGGGRTDGVLAAGTITAANLIGPLAGHPLSDLIHALRADSAYGNVHTNDGVAPTNTGPGDFPGGEIRGQIRTAGPRP